MRRALRLFYFCLLLWILFIRQEGRPDEKGIETCKLLKLACTLGRSQEGRPDEKGIEVL